MKLIIDIPKGTYEAVKVGTINQVLEYKVWNAIKNGTPLPKGHGRLIDADALYEDLIFPNEQFSKAFKEILDDAPTIIEADMRGE